MWYIIQDETLIDFELGSLDILQYMGETLICEDEDGLPDATFTIDDDFILEWGWFEDVTNWDAANSYRKGMGCSVKEAWEQWGDAYAGEYASEKAFSQALHEELLSKLPTFLQTNIDWQGVWDSTDRHSFFESDGFFFEHL